MVPKVPPRADIPGDIRLLARSTRATRIGSQQHERPARSSRRAPTSLRGNTGREVRAAPLDTLAVELTCFRFFRRPVGSRPTVLPYIYFHTICPNITINFKFVRGHPVINIIYKFKCTPEEYHKFIPTDQGYALQNLAQRRSPIPILTLLLSPNERTTESVTAPDCAYLTSRTGACGIIILVRHFHPF